MADLSSWDYCHLAVLEVIPDWEIPKGPIRKAQEEDTVYEHGCAQLKYNLTVLIAVKLWFRHGRNLNYSLPLSHYSSH